MTPGGSSKCRPTSLGVVGVGGSDCRGLDGKSESDSDPGVDGMNDSAAVA